MDDFDPRKATLRYASLVPSDEGRGLVVNTIACGLVYVGDQIAALRKPHGGVDEALENLEALLTMLDPESKNGSLMEWAVGYREEMERLRETARARGVKV